MLFGFLIPSPPILLPHPHPAFLNNCKLYHTFDHWLGSDYKARFPVVSIVPTPPPQFLIEHQCRTRPARPSPQRTSCRCCRRSAGEKSTSGAGRGTRRFLCCSFFAACRGRQQHCLFHPAGPSSNFASPAWRTHFAKSSRHTAQPCAWSPRRPRRQQQ